MGKRGPAPKATALRVLEGNPSRRPINEHEPRPIGEPVAPSCLDDAAMVYWNMIVQHTPPGLYTAVDAPLLAQWCVACAGWDEATDKIRKTGGEVIPDMKGSIKGNPWSRVQRQYAEEKRALESKLGFSPSARTGLVAPAPRGPVGIAALTK